MIILSSRIALRSSAVVQRRLYSAALSELTQQLQQELSAIQDAGTYKRERIIIGRQGVSIHVASSTEPILNFCANNYLGLSSHPEVIEAGKRTLETHGAGLSSVEWGFRQLEQKLAKFHGRDDAILYAACFDANGGIFEVLLGKDDAVITDSLNHASIIDGIRLSKAQRHIYAHMDLRDLEEKLKLTANCRRRLIVTDGVFSMDGDVAPLKEICDLADRTKSLVFVDECHATGFFGRTGRGTEEYLGLKNRVDIINSTLGKALCGAMGGYTVGPQPVIDLLRQRARPYLFSNSLAPPVVGSAIKALDLLMANPDENPFAASVTAKTHRFRKAMTAAGFKLSGSFDHPICPVMLGDAKLAGQFANEMLERGIYVIGFSFPVVPQGKARIRMRISAAHSEAHIDKAVVAFIEVGKKLRVI